uniref:Uncharacterized protein n=1 Tax=Timema monikensis TaxID=170555 RepID=A0A7R9HSM6_9NEOP|nr:unnamed protein product [Timema monikensis]
MSHQGCDRAMTSSVKPIESEGCDIIQGHVSTCLVNTPDWHQFKQTHRHHCKDHFLGFRGHETLTPINISANNECEEKKLTSTSSCNLSTTKKDVSEFLDQSKVESRPIDLTIPTDLVVFKEFIVVGTECVPIQNEQNESSLTISGTIEDTNTILAVPTETSETGTSNNLNSEISDWRNIMSPNESRDNFINDPNWTPDENDTDLSMDEKRNNEINLPILCETESMEEAIRVECPETDVVLGEDKRGRHIPANKLSDAEVEKIKRHIEQFPVTESHYCRRGTSRKYLDKDEKIRIEQDYLDHKEREKEANLAKASDKERAASGPTFVSATFDMQSVLQEKYNDLKNLCNSGVIPNEFHHWYLSLPYSRKVKNRNPEPSVESIPVQYLLTVRNRSSFGGETNPTTVEIISDGQVQLLPEVN